MDPNSTLETIVTIGEQALCVLYGLDVNLNQPCRELQQ